MKVCAKKKAIAEKKMGRYGKKDSPWRIYMKVSSAMLFIPAIVSLYTQTLMISIVLLLASTFSTMYHLSDEESHGTSDEIWASLTLMVLLVLSLRLSAELGFIHWRVISIWAIGITAIVAYLTYGCRSDTSVTSEKYELWHSLWHTFAAIAALLVVYKRSTIQFHSDESFVDWLKRSFHKSRENIRDGISYMRGSSSTPPPSREPSPIPEAKEKVDKSTTVSYNSSIMPLTI